MDTQLYFIALVPPNEIEQEVIRLKNYMKSDYGSSAALRSPPHITLYMPFRFREDKEQFLISKLEEFTSKYSPVIILLDDFGAFPPRVIYINVSANETLIKIYRDLQKWMKTDLSIFSKDNPYRGFNPHMTIAFRDLKKTMFHKAWEEFKDKKFRFSFTATSCVLLKHDGKKWQKFQSLEFSP